MSSLPKDFPKFSDVLSVKSNPEDLFILICPIGKGAFGNVHKAIHKTSLKLFAIKIIDYTKDGLDNKNKISLNYNLIQEETALMRLVQNNDNILKYYGSYYSRKSNMIWLILEYCSCGSLRDLMYSIDRPFSEIEIATLIKMVLKGLIYLHDLNIIHRDIKAQNILLTEDGYAKIGDFGVGIKLTEKEFRRSKKGSPYWMSPQIVLQEDYDIKTDIWSLGITCIELFEGEPPFADLKPTAIMNKIKKGVKVEDMINVNECSKSFVDFLKKCIVVDPNKRATAKELIEHEFIQKIAQEKEYIEDLIKQYNEEIKQYMDEKCKDIEDFEQKTETNIKIDIDNINPPNNEAEENHEENKENELEKKEEDNNTMIVIPDKHNEENSKIIEEYIRYIIPSNNSNEEEHYKQKKSKEMQRIPQEKINGKNNKEEEEKEVENNKNNMKIPSKEEKKEKYENNDSMNINDKINRNNNNNIDKKRSEVTTGITGSKPDISDGKKFLHNLVGLENKIDFIECDLSNIDNDSEDEQINPIKNCFSTNFEENKFNKYFNERNYVNREEKQYRINFLDGDKMKKYLNDSDINTKNDNVVKKINFSAIKKHKKYFN